MTKCRNYLHNKHDIEFGSFGGNFKNYIDTEILKEKFKT
jgi:hypothetical protein